MKLLLVDDDLLLAKTIKHSLFPSFTVETVHSGEDAVYYAVNYSYDVILLDISLPDMQGIEVRKHIRSSNIDTPILFLTAKHDITAKVTTFVNGADDYLTKPFYKEELLSRIKAVVRRYDRRRGIDRILLDDIEINLEKRTICYQGCTIILRQKDFDIFSLLVRNRGKVIHRRTLQGYVWGDEIELSSSTIDVHINYLRVHLEKQIGRQLIRTIHGVGFIIEYSISPPTVMNLQYPSEINKYIQLGKLSAGLLHDLSHPLMSVSYALQELKTDLDQVPASGATETALFHALQGVEQLEKLIHCAKQQMLNNQSIRLF